MPERTSLDSHPNAFPMDLDPLIITSPGPRCGTTLLQRLLCSSKRALIFGEKSVHDFEIFLNLYMAKVQEYGYSRESYNQELRKVLQGEVNDWIVSLMPDLDGYLAALRASAFAGLAYCRDFAVRAGRPVWGFKYPGWPPGMMGMIRAGMPGARFIFIQRDLPACLKSAKAQQLVVTEQDLRRFCQTWAAGVASAHEMKDGQAILFLNYEDLVQRPEDALASIAQFSGLPDLDRSVLERKINVWTGQQFGAQLENGYIPPAELTEAESGIVNEFMTPQKA